MRTINYRADIDGLRALAVLSVMFYHVFPNKITGGFVGVDLFFVISGFLISTIIYESLATNEFNFFNFYSRRIRRIFPSLVVVLFCCLIFGWLYLYADEFKLLGKHTMVSAGFIQNIILWKESGYFDAASDLKPLLHIWSLGIEEQFYFVWPVLLWWAAKKKLNLFAVGFIAAAISFYLSLKIAKADPIGNFYLPQTRLWELIAGGLIAWLRLYKSELLIFKSDKLKNIFSFLGIILFFFAVLKYNKHTVFPGQSALLPVLGGGLMIVSQNSFLNKKILSNKILVWIGLISYPLYLWHWPLLSFARFFNAEELSIVTRFFLVGLSFLFSWATVKFVEAPLRFGGENRKKVVSLCVLLAVVGGFGGMVLYRDGFPARMGEDAEFKHATKVNSLLDEGRKNCKKIFPEWQYYRCIFQKVENPTVLMIGDSHADDLYPGLVQLFKGNDSLGVMYEACASPFINVASCTRKNWGEPVKTYYLKINSAIEYAAVNKDIKVVVFSHWAYGSLVDSIDMENPEDKNFSAIFERGLERSLQRLLKAGKKVIYVMDRPALNFDAKRCRQRSDISFFSNNECSYSRKDFDEERIQIEYRTILRRVAKKYSNMKVFDPIKEFCDDKTCYVSRGKKLLYRDYSHLSLYGSERVAPSLYKLISISLSEKE